MLRASSGLYSLRARLNNLEEDQKVLAGTKVPEVSTKVQVLKLQTPATSSKVMTLAQPFIYVTFHECYHNNVPFFSDQPPKKKIKQTKAGASSSRPSGKRTRVIEEDEDEGDAEEERLQVWSLLSISLLWRLDLTKPLNGY